MVWFKFGSACFRCNGNRQCIQFIPLPGWWLPQFMQVLFSVSDTGPIYAAESCTVKFLGILQLVHFSAAKSFIWPQLLQVFIVVFFFTRWHLKINELHQFSSSIFVLKIEMVLISNCENRRAINLVAFEIREEIIRTFIAWIKCIGGTQIPSHIEREFAFFIDVNE